MAALNAEVARLEISRQGMIASMRDQFTDRFIFIRELMQNARRAGASRVDVDVNEASRAITFTDDGQGIPDLHVLFRLGESGWSDLEVLETEHPFGVGFVAVLFQAKSVGIRTRGWSTSFDTAGVLAGGGATIESGCGFAGTEITLVFAPEVFEAVETVEAFPANDRPRFADQVRAQVALAAQGFPLPVFRDGKPMERSDVWDASGLEVPGVGWVFGLEEKVEALAQCFEVPRTTLRDQGRFYLQGFSLAVPGSQDPLLAELVVHLDSTQFRARMPDRACLVDGETHAKTIAAGVSQVLRDHLEGLKVRLGDGPFAERYFAVASHFHPDLVAQSPIPSWMVGFAMGVPTLRDFGFFGSRPVWVPRDGDLVVPSTDRLLVREPGLTPLDCIDSGGCGDAAEAVATANEPLAWALVQALELPLVEFNGTQLPQGHWGHDKLVCLEELEYEYEFEGAREVVDFDCHIEFDLVFCDRIHVRSRCGTIPWTTLTAHAIWHYPNQVDGHPRVYIPLGGTEGPATDVILGQITLFEDDMGVINDLAMAEAERHLEQLSELARGGDTKVFLERALSRALPPEIRGQFADQQFMVSVGDDGSLAIEAA